MKYRHWLASSAILLIAACTNVQQHELVLNIPPEQLEEYVADKPEPAKRLYARVLLEGKRNEALNHMRSGLAAMELGDAENAARSFDIALDTIEAIYADNPKAEAARSLWTKENVKDFKGEPYERAMAYYYRGLLYMWAGDYENARASFKGGILQSTFSYNERYDADYPMFNFLEGWVARCTGAASSATEAFEVAAKGNSDLAEPPKEHNTLVLVELGNPPRKVAKGKYNELLGFAEGMSSDITSAAVEMRNAGPVRTVSTAAAAAKTWPTHQAANLYQLATTRNGRPIDAILDGKAQFKEGTKIASDVAIGVGAAAFASGNRDAQAVGAALMLIGMMGEAAAAAMRPEADVRMWDNLPGAITLATLDAPLAGGGSASPLEAVLLDSAGAEVKRVPVDLKSGSRCNVGWVRANSALDVADSAPGAVVLKRK